MDRTKCQETKKTGETEMIQQRFFPCSRVFSDFDLPGVRAFRVFVCQVCSIYSLCSPAASVTSAPPIPCVLCLVPWCFRVFGVFRVFRGSSTWLNHGTRGTLGKTLTPPNYSCARRAMIEPIKPKSDTVLRSSPFLLNRVSVL